MDKIIFSKILKLNIIIGKIYINTFKIDNFFLKTYKIIIISFLF